MTRQENFIKLWEGSLILNRSDLSYLNLALVKFKIVGSAVHFYILNFKLILKIRLGKKYPIHVFDLNTSYSRSDFNGQLQFVGLTTAYFFGRKDNDFKLFLEDRKQGL